MPVTGGSSNRDRGVGPSGEGDGAATLRAVGIWLEIPAAEVPIAGEDERVRLARNLAIGLAALPGVTRILVPCQPSTIAAMAALFADPARPGHLVADALEIVPAGGDQRLRNALTAWVERCQLRCRESLGDMHATANPGSWPGALERLRDERVGRPRLGLAMLRRAWRLVRIAAWCGWLEAARFLLALLPAPHAGVAADLRRRGIEATWLVPHATTSRVSPARPVGGRLHSPGAECTADHDDLAPLAPALAWHDGLDDHGSRQLLGGALRESFLSGPRGAAYRHFCDFPFERVDYLLVPVRGRPWPDSRAVVGAYAKVLRRHRRHLKLVLIGHATRQHTLRDELCAQGLVFDVVEIAALPEDARARLIRHASAVVIPPGTGAPLPSMVTEAISLHTPVVWGRRTAARWLAVEEATGAECFEEAADGADALAAAILHALDFRNDVLPRQQSILRRLAERTWTDVAKEALTASLAGR